MREMFSLAVVVFIALGFWSCFLFDRLLRILHRDSPSSWEEQGRPTGFFWYPVGAGTSGMWARERTAILWSLKTPEWAHSSGEAQRLFGIYHGVVAVSFLLGLFLVGSVLAGISGS